MTEFKCTVCGYIHEGYAKPEICPVCGASKERFLGEEKKPKSKAKTVPPKKIKVSEAKPIIIHEEHKEEEHEMEKEEEIKIDIQRGELDLKVRNITKEEEYRKEDFLKKIIHKSQHETSLYCFKPGQKQKMHQHPDAEKTLCVVKGTAQIETDEGTKTLEEGDVVFLPKGVMHSLKSTGNNDLVVLQFVTPYPYQTKSS